MEFLREKEQRRLSGEHIASQTQIKSRTGTIYEHWRFLTKETRRKPLWIYPMR